MKTPTKWGSALFSLIVLMWATAMVYWAVTHHEGVLMWLLLVVFVFIGANAFIGLYAFSERALRVHRNEGVDEDDE